MFKKILVPTDASDSARHALTVALELAEEFDSQILLLHVVYSPEAIGYTFYSGSSAPLEDLSIIGKEVLTVALAGIDTRNVPIEKKHLPGHPGIIILEEIVNGNFDLVIMGNHSYGAIAGSLLGSVSQRVLSKAKCPVMIVK